MRKAMSVILAFHIFGLDDLPLSVGLSMGKAMRLDILASHMFGLDDLPLSEGLSMGKDMLGVPCEFQ